MQAAAQLKSIKMLQIGLYFTCDREGKKGNHKGDCRENEGGVYQYNRGKRKACYFYAV